MKHSKRRRIVKQLRQERNAVAAKVQRFRDRNMDASAEIAQREYDRLTREIQRVSNGLR